MSVFERERGKLVVQPDGTIYEVRPGGWKRRKDIEQDTVWMEKLKAQQAEIEKKKLRGKK